MSTRDPRGYRIGTLGGIPLFAAPSWIIIALILTIMYAPVVQIRIPELAVTHTYLLAATFVLLLFASVLAHEIGHAFTARALHVDVDSVTLWMLGGYTSMRHEPPTPRAEFLISAAGPAISLALSGIGWAGYATTNTTPVIHELLWQLAISNLLLGIFNLLPGLPLDGGSILRSLSWAISNKRTTGTLIAGWCGRILALLLIATAILFTISSYIAGIRLSIAGLILTLFVGVFLYSGATAAIRTARLTERATTLQPDTLTHPIAPVTSDTPLSHALETLTNTPEARALVTTNTDGTLSGIVHLHAARAVPKHRQPWLNTEELSQAPDPHTLVTTELTGEELIELLRTHPARQYLVCDHDNHPVGVIETEELMRKL